MKNNNLLIALFMGRAGKQNKNLYWVNIDGTSWVNLEEMKFHTSWDWLMPVVQKIIKELKYDVTISCDIDVTYTNVVNFINWYNGKNK